MLPCCTWQRRNLTALSYTQIYARRNPRKKCWHLTPSVTSRVPLDGNNRVYVLHTIATIIRKDAVQRITKRHDRGTSQKGCSVFRDLLNHLTDDITNLDTKQKNEIIRSLDKIQEFNHRLYQTVPGSQIVQCGRIKTSKAKIRRARLGKVEGGGEKKWPPCLSPAPGRFSHFFFKNFTTISEPGTGYVYIKWLTSKLH